MKRFLVSALVLAASAVPAFAGTAPALPEPATMTLFALCAGGAYLAKRVIGRK